MRLCACSTLVAGIRPIARSGRASSPFTAATCWVHRRPQVARLPPQGRQRRRPRRRHEVLRVGGRIPQQHHVPRGRGLPLVIRVRHEAADRLPRGPTVTEHRGDLLERHRLHASAPGSPASREAAPPPRGSSAARSAGSPPGSPHCAASRAPDAPPAARERPRPRRRGSGVPPPPGTAPSREGFDTGQPLHRGRPAQPRSAACHSEGLRPRRVPRNPRRRPLAADPSSPDSTAAPRGDGERHVQNHRRAVRGPQPPPSLPPGSSPSNTPALASDLCG